MNIIVCIKQVPGKDAPLSIAGNWIKESDIGFEMNEPDSYALEEALQLKEKHGGEVVALSLGPERVKQTIKEALAKGADRGIHIADDNFAQLDPLGAAKVLAAAIAKEKYDLVLTGLQSDDHGFGQTGGSCGRRENKSGHDCSNNGLLRVTREEAHPHPQGDERIRCEPAPGSPLARGLLSAFRGRRRCRSGGRCCFLGTGAPLGIDGPNMLAHLGGGQGGIQHAIDHLFAPMTTWWATSDPELTPELKKQIADGTLQLAGNRSIEELERERDTMLLELLATRSKGEQAAQVAVATRGRAQA